MKTVAEVRAYMAQRIDMAGVQVGLNGSNYYILFKADKQPQYEKIVDVTGKTDAEITTLLTAASDEASTAILALKNPPAPVDPPMSKFYKGYVTREATRILQ